MRALTLTTLLLGLPGCAIDNPRFGVLEDSATTAADPTTAAASTTPTGASATGVDEPTGSGPGTGDEPDTSPVDPDTDTSAGTSTGGPGTTQTGDPGDSSSGDSSDTDIEPIPMPMACVQVAVDFTPYLLVNDQKLDQCPATEIFINGRLAVGQPLQFASTPDCGGNGQVYTLGTGLGLPQQDLSGCLKTQLKLSNTQAGCKIDLIKIYDPKTNPTQYHLLAAFSALPDGLPLQPIAANSGYCGCPDPNNNNPGCCAGLDPGELTLQPTLNDPPVAQFQHTPVSTPDGQIFEFYNIQSWVGPACADDQHIDWVAARKP